VNSKSNSNQEKTTDSIYELSCYNSNGIVNMPQLRKYASLIFVTVFSISFLINYVLTYTGSLNPFLINFYTELIDYNYTIISSALLESELPPAKYLQEVSLSFIIALIPTIYFIIKKVRASRFQAILASVSLSQYYFYQQSGQTIYLKFKKGHKNAYKSFITQQENLIQMLNKENIQLKRWKNNGVIIQYSDKFPAIEELSNLKIKDFIKQEKLFLGIGLPIIGEEYKKSDLIQGKYLARYLNFTNIPQGVANLGSAGGGKSNSMNQYFYSIFLNFDKIHSFYMIDFKGGIEAEPIKDLELKYKTGKIEIFDDNRVALYKALKKLYFINKSRMRYLRSTKQKKFTSDFIILVFDELAEILDYTPSTKEERKVQEKISFYIESLLRTGRSQGFKIFYSTQSYLSTSSGLSSSMKNNTKLKIAHQLGSGLQVGSVKPVEELNELGIFPTKYDVGKNVVINEADNTIYEVRSLYVPDDFIETITLNTDTNDELEEELKAYYQATYEEQLNDLKSTGQEDDTIYSLHDIANELGLSITEQVPETVISTPEPKNTKKEVPTISISKAIQAKKLKKDETYSKKEENFLKSLK